MLPPLFVNHGLYISKCLSIQVELQNGSCEFFSWPSQGQGQGQMSNTNNYCLEFLLTTYDITIVNETIQFTYIILQMDILQRNNEV